MCKCGYYSAFLIIMLSEDLEMSASHFRSGSRRLQRKLWWQNVRVSGEPVQDRERHNYTMYILQTVLVTCYNWLKKVSFSGFIFTTVHIHTCTCIIIRLFWYIHIWCIHCLYYKSNSQMTTFQLTWLAHLVTALHWYRRAIGLNPTETFLRLYLVC